MRIVNGDKLVAFVFDNEEDIEAMLLELARMRAQVKEGVVKLPVSFLGIDENATPEDREKFLTTMMGEGGGG